jgi:hypothetical protein
VTFREIISLFSDNRMKHVSTVWGQAENLLSFTDLNFCLTSAAVGSGVWGEGLALPPDGEHNDGVAPRDDEGRHHKEWDSYQRDVQLPLPRLRKLYPALRLACNRQHIAASSLADVSAVNTKNVVLWALTPCSLRSHVSEEPATPIFSGEDYCLLECDVL